MMQNKVSNEILAMDFEFSILAKISGAITFDEFLQWVYLTIERYDDLPTYIFDLCDAKSINDVYSIRANAFIRTIDDGLSVKESDVLSGIAAKRGLFFDEDCISRKTALKRLEQYPHVVERFKKTFPFIKLDF